MQSLNPLITKMSEELRWEQMLLPKKNDHSVLRNMPRYIM